MMEESVADYLQRAPLFPGTSCPSLSGDGLHDPFSFKPGKETEYDRVDQLQVILDVIGTPNEEEVRSVGNPSTEKFLRELPHRPPQVCFQ